MDLWIRSQDKTILSKAINLIIRENQTENNNINYAIVDIYVMGYYLTKERALEVLDEIQNLITRNNETVVIRLSNEDFIKQMPVYEMPKE